MADIILKDTEKVVVSKNEFAGREYIHIRKFFKNGEEWLPTKKGISLEKSIMGKVIEHLLTEMEG